METETTTSAVTSDESRVTSENAESSALRTSEPEAPPAPIAEWQSTVAELRAELEELKASLGAHAPSQPSAPDPTDGVTGVAPVSGVGVVQDSTDNLLAYCETHADDPLSCIAALRASTSRK